MTNTVGGLGCRGLARQIGSARYLMISDRPVLLLFTGNQDQGIAVIVRTILFVLLGRIYETSYHDALPMTMLLISVSGRGQ